jgi:hypothetical protein
LSKTECEDLRTALEITVRTGNYRYQDWRIHTEWKNRKCAAAVMAEIDAANANAAEEEDDETKDDDDAKSETEKRPRNQSTATRMTYLTCTPKIFAFMEKGGNDPALWPAKTFVKRRERATDAEWETEHGDQIHPRRFSAQVLQTAANITAIARVYRWCVAAGATVSNGNNVDVCRCVYRVIGSDQGEFSIAKKRDLVRCC